MYVYPFFHVHMYVHICTYTYMYVLWCSYAITIPGICSFDGLTICCEGTPEAHKGPEYHFRFNFQLEAYVYWTLNIHYLRSRTFFCNVLYRSLSKSWCIDQYFNLFTFELNYEFGVKFEAINDLFDLNIPKYSHGKFGLHFQIKF